MIINWKKPKAGLLMLPVMSKDGKSIEKNLKLVPGFNEINDEDWKGAQKHEAIQKKIELGYIEIKTIEIENLDGEKPDGKKPDGKKVKKPASTLKDVKAQEAIEIIQDTWDVGILNKWKKVESRDEVRAQLANQLEKIEKSGTTQ